MYDAQSVQIIINNS